MECFQNPRRPLCSLSQSIPTPTGKHYFNWSQFSWDPQSHLPAAFIIQPLQLFGFPHPQRPASSPLAPFLPCIAQPPAPPETRRWRGSSKRMASTFFSPFSPCSCCDIPATRFLDSSSPLKAELGWQRLLWREERGLEVVLGPKVDKRSSPVDPVTLGLTSPLEPSSSS